MEIYFRKKVLELRDVRSQCVLKMIQGQDANQFVHSASIQF